MASGRYEVWHNPQRVGNPIYYVPYEYDDKWALEKHLWYPTEVHTTFVRHWRVSFYLVLLYVAGIHYLKWWMRDRKPFELRNFLVFWNAGLAIFSAMGAWRFGQEFLYVMTNRTFQDSVCLSIQPSEVAAFWSLLFALSKVAEFGDTVLLMLRKRPLIFLHWFHHSVVLVYSWHSATELTAAGRWFIQLNYTVHAIMYTYYTFSSLGFRFPKWVSMSVTTLQTTQMLIGVFISLYVARLKLLSSRPTVCQQSIENMCICFSIYTAFAFLFIRFFVNSYLLGKKPTAAKAVKKAQ
uniref:Elongation of very long chain fatty acids protein n=1 Tax=Globodera rostochiensis TaxID=31243 RepID=A0A914HAQ1_GLORO